MTMTGEDLFWDLDEPMYAAPAVQRSTMMGLPCVSLGTGVDPTAFRRLVAAQRGSLVNPSFGSR